MFELTNNIKNEIIDKNVLMLESDLNGTIIHVSQALCDFYGEPQELLVGQKCSHFKKDNLPKEFYKKLWDTIQSGNEWNGEVHNMKVNGDLVWLKATITPLYTNNSITAYLAIYQDITLKKHLEHLVAVDHLTKVANRSHYEAYLEEMLLHHKEYHYIALMIFDIDDFKLINDKYGHDVGDNVLVEFATILKENIRKEDLCARFGGEEFIIILPHASEEIAVNIANKLLTYIRDTTFANGIKITSSVGLANYVQNDTRLTLFKKADTCLYEAKNSGKDKLVY